MSICNEGTSHAVSYLQLVTQYYSVSENPRFSVADFATLSDDRRSRSKILLLFSMDKRTLRSKI